MVSMCLWRIPKSADISFRSETAASLNLSQISWAYNKEEESIKRRIYCVQDVCGKSRTWNIVID